MHGCYGDDGGLRFSYYLVSQRSRTCFERHLNAVQKKCAVKGTMSFTRIMVYSHCTGLVQVRGTGPAQ